MGKWEFRVGNVGGRDGLEWEGREKRVEMDLKKVVVAAMEGEEGWWRWETGEGEDGGNGGKSGWNREDCRSPWPQDVDNKR